MQTKLTTINSSSNFFPLVNVNQLAEKKKVYMNTLTFLFVTLETILVTVLFYSLYHFRVSQEFSFSFNYWTLDLPRIKEYGLFYLLAIGLYFSWSYKFRTYSFDTRKSFSDQFYKIIKSYSYAVLITIGIAFILKIVAYSRLIVIGFWFGGILLSGLLHLFKRLVFIYYARQGKMSQNVLVIGAGKIGSTIVNEFNSNPTLGYRVVGFVDDQNRKSVLGVPILGKTNDLLSIIKRENIDEIIVTIPSEREMVNRLIQQLRKFDVQIKIIPDMYNLVTTSVEFGHINALPYVTIVKTPMRGPGLVIKRAFDVIATSIALTLLLPVLLLTAISIKLDSKGPVIYRQQRIGKNGQIFNMLKFRSMIANADELKDSLSKLNEADGPVFKIKNDPRVTKLGGFIRKYSIDELPQLLNVLKGDMSLVGPRPPVPTEVERYGDSEWRRLEVLPGITGLWQVSGRSDLSFQQWMNLDLYYIENWSLALDLKILLKTIPTVLKGEGAY